MAKWVASLMNFRHLQHPHPLQRGRHHSRQQVRAARHLWPRVPPSQGRVARPLPAHPRADRLRGAALGEVAASAGVRARGSEHWQGRSRARCGVGCAFLVCVFVWWSPGERENLCCDVDISRESRIPQVPREARESAEPLALHKREQPSPVWSCGRLGLRAWASGG